MSELPRLRAIRRTGDERFTRGDSDLGFSLQDFWCWSTSDLLNNTTRGVLAEFLVARAVGVPTAGVREPWAAYDLETEDGLKIEVKSSAYLQAWHQKKKSAIAFGVRETRHWDADTGAMAVEAVRQADVYVFALLAHEDKATANPLDVSQWEFYVVPSKTLNERTGNQHSISLKILRTLSGGPVAYGELGAAVRSSSRHSSRG